MAATVRVAARLNANRAAVPNYLDHEWERQAWRSGVPWAMRIVFGNAVERALARGAAPTGLLIHTGDIRPFQRGGPDMIGAPGSPLEGLLFQATSEPGYWTHVDKSAPETIWGLYPTFAP